MTIAKYPLQQNMASLYGEHHDWLLGWLRKRLGCRQHAADVAQDTFLRLAAAGDKLPPLLEPRAFLTTTAKRLMLDRVRRQAVEQAYMTELEAASGQPPCFPAPDEILVAAQSLERISGALEQLSERARDAFLMHYVDGESHAVIAERLGVSTRMVHKYLAQADQCMAGIGRPLHKHAVVRAAAALMVALAVGLFTVAEPRGDMQTSTGEWQTRILGDGSRVTLAGASAIDVNMTNGRRVVKLLRGEVLVDVARDPARPFIVTTDDGSIRALGTRFTVERGEQATELAMLESKTEVRAAGGKAAPVVVAAGEKVRITKTGVSAATPVDAGSVADAWRDHQLVVQDRPLAEVLDQLSRHRRGLLKYDERQIAAMRVTAVLPLDDTDRALHLLLDSFPALRVRTITPYVVLVDAPGR